MSFEFDLTGLINGEKMVRVMQKKEKKEKMLVRKNSENVLVPVQHFTVSALLTFLYFKPIIQMLLGSGFNLTLKRTFEKNLIKVVEGLQNSKINIPSC